MAIGLGEVNGDPLALLLLSSLDPNIDDAVGDDFGSALGKDIGAVPGESASDLWYDKKVRKWRNENMLVN